MSKLFTQTIIAVVWDFDKTLIPGYMQRPLFEKYQIDEKLFWQEVNELPALYQGRGCEQVSTEVFYLNHILDYIRQQKFPNLSNKILRDLGGKLELYPGLPDFFSTLKNELNQEIFKSHEITLEHYVVSTGLTQMIKGSAIAPYLDGIWGCEFLEDLDSKSQVLTQLGYVLDNTTKTRAIFEINKGANKHPEINVNARVAEEDRRIPIQNMIYIADGPSDVPVFSVVNHNGGKTYGVYKQGSDSEFKQANSLQEQGRVQSFGPADYSAESQTTMWLTNAVRSIAERIVRDRERALGEKVGEAPKHIN
ncbi:MAG TPA: haloacid dehalogenase-like hydrolase [Gammaproteobacteria bacterium]|jgi:hypothetical protein|nr:haloacid dehalogenase-like hydrolase [Gammaproteobacteria bacterium]